MKEKVQAALDKVRPSLTGRRRRYRTGRCQERHCQRPAAGPLRRLTDVTDDAQDGRREVLKRTGSGSQTGRRGLVPAPKQNN